MACRRLHHVPGNSCFGASIRRRKQPVRPLSPSVFYLVSLLRDSSPDTAAFEAPANVIAPPGFLAATGQILTFNVPCKYSQRVSTRSQGARSAHLRGDPFLARSSLSLLAAAVLTPHIRLNARSGSPLPLAAWPAMPTRGLLLVFGAITCSHTE